MFQELRWTVRSLSRSPGFALAALATLTLGIGANTIVFSFVNGILLRPLPFGEVTDRLVSIHSVHPTQFPDDWDDAEVSTPESWIRSYRFGPPCSRKLRPSAT